MFNSTVDSLKKKSQTIKSVFTKTVKDLTTVNDTINKEVSNREGQIAELELEVSDLKTQAAANEKFVTKINEFLYS